MVVKEVLNKKTVTLLGINSLFGRITSLLLKQSIAIKHLCLYDENNITTACDVAVINTPCKVRAFQGRDQLPCAIQNADVILIADTCNYYCDTPEILLEEGAPRIVELGKVIAEKCSKAVILVAASPVNTLLPLLCEVLTYYNAYDCNKVLGITSVDNIRANSILANHLKRDPRHIVLPVVGGNSPDTRVPIFSQARPSVKLSKRIMKKLTKEIKYSDLKIFRAKGELEAVNKAYAAARFVHSVLAGLRGEPNIAEIALTRSVFLPGTHYFALPFILGGYGIEYRFPLPDLTPFEENFICHAVIEMYRDSKKGEKYFSPDEIKRELNIVDCKEKGLILGNIFNHFRVGRAEGKGNLEYLLMTNKQKIEYPPSHQPAKFPVPAIPAEPFQHCYEGCNPLDLPILPTEKRRAPPSPESGICCLEPPVQERKDCPTTGNCKFKPCNFPFTTDSPQRLSEKVNKRDCGTIPLPPKMKQGQEIQKNECEPQNVESRSLDQFQEDLQFLPLTENTKVEVGPKTCINLPNPDLDKSQSKTHTQTPNSDETSNTQTFGKSQPSCSQQELSKETSTESKLQSKTGVNLFINVKEKVASHRPEPKASVTAQESFPPKNSKKGNVEHNLRKEERIDDDIKNKGVIRIIMPGIKCPNEKKFSKQVNEGNLQPLTDINIGKKVNQEENPNIESQINTSFTQMINAKPKSTYEINLLEKSKPNLNDIQSILHILMGKLEKEGVKKESRNKFSMKNWYKTVFPGKAKKNVKESKTNEKFEQKSEKASSSDKVLNKEKASSSDKLSTKDKLPTDNQQIPKDKLPVGNLKVQAQLKKEETAYAFRDDETANDKSRSHVSSHMYAPRCPPQYLLGEYIPHKIKDNEIAFDNVKEHFKGEASSMKHGKSIVRDPDMIKRKNSFIHLKENNLENESVRKKGFNLLRYENKSKKMFESKAKNSLVKPMYEVKKKTSRTSFLPLTSPNASDVKFSEAPAQFYIKKRNDGNSDRSTQRDPNKRVWY